LWLNSYEPAALLIPLVSWVTPAHVPEGYLLKPSLKLCQQHLSWRPDIVVGDLGYINQQTKKEIRQTWQVAVITKLKADMNIIEPFDAWNQLSCQHGQILNWLSYDDADQVHWFGAPLHTSLCQFCWEASDCPKEFGYPAQLHETLLGLLPLNTLAAQRLLKQVRSWIEPCQAYEKNLLGMKNIFLNSLRLTWTVSLLADAVALLRALALLSAEATPVQEQLEIRQLNLPFERHKT
jgi:hypothetical protein